MTGRRYDAEWERAVARLREMRRLMVAQELRKAKQKDEIEVEILAVRNLDGG